MTELVQELLMTAFLGIVLMTAFLGIVFSFPVAKLVSMAAGGKSGHDSSKSFDFVPISEEVKFDRGLTVQSTETKGRVQFVEVGVNKMVDEFEGKLPVQVQQKLEGRVCEGLVEICDAAGVIEVEESVKEAVGLRDKSRAGFGGKAVSVGIVSGDGFGVAEEETLSTGFDGLAVDGRHESTEADEFDCLGTESTVGLNSLIVERSIGKNAITVDQSEEVRGMVRGENRGSGIEMEEKKLFVGDEDDWEGIERSEMEKVFAAAAKYVGCRGMDDGLANVGSDVQMQLYGLHKVAMEGPCREPQPMALKISARAKWNAWQRLGNMSPEAAMEHYVKILSDRIPGWMEGDSAGDGKQESSVARLPQAPDSIMSTLCSIVNHPKMT